VASRGETGRGAPPPRASARRTIRAFPATHPAARSRRRDSRATDAGRETEGEVAGTRAQPRRPGAWPWIAGLVVLALLIWGITSLLDDSGAVVEEASSPAPAAAP